MSEVKMFVMQNGMSIVGKIIEENEKEFICENLIALAQGPQGIGIMPYPLGVIDDAKININKNHISITINEEYIEPALLDEYKKVTSNIEIVNSTDNLQSKILDINKMRN